MEMVKTKKVIRINGKREIFCFWKDEGDAFRDLFGGLSENELSEIAITSGCGHTLGDHIKCVLAWMSAGLSFFESRENGMFFAGTKGETVVQKTDNLLKLYENISYSDAWKQIRETEKRYRSLIKRLNERAIFQDEYVWEWFVWTTFGHYREHCDEIILQFLTSTKIPDDVIWLPPSE